MLMINNKAIFKSAKIFIQIAVSMSERVVRLLTGGGLEHHYLLTYTS